MRPGPSPGWGWRPTQSTSALAPRAVVAHGEAALRLLGRLVRLPSARRESLELTAAAGWLVVMGATDDLPWADGVRYAAPSAVAAALWLPTHVEPDVPADLLARALLARHARQPLLLWNEPAGVMPLDHCQTASDTVLAMVGRAWKKKPGLEAFP